MDKTTDLFEVTKIINNIKNHNFSVADYKLCESEAKIVSFYLEWVRSVLKEN